MIAKNLHTTKPMKRMMETISKDWKQEEWMLSRMSNFERFNFTEMERLIWVFGRSVGGVEGGG